MYNERKNPSNRFKSPSVSRKRQAHFRKFREKGFDEEQAWTHCVKEKAQLR